MIITPPKMKRHRIFKTISLITAAAFFMSVVAPQPGWATKAGVPPQKELAENSAGSFFDPKKIALSSELGTIRDLHIQKDSPLIIQIQDAHSNYNAQKKLADILKKLIKDYGVRLVMVEGGWGDASLSYLRNYADAKKRADVAEGYLKRGEISGEEYLDIISDLDFKLIGAEDEASYLANREAFLKLHSVQKKAAWSIEGMKFIADQIKPSIYNKHLRGLEEQRLAFDEEKIAFPAYYKYLGDLARRLKIDIAQYPNISLMLKVAELEPRIDFDAADDERATLVEKLSKTLKSEDLTNLLTRSLEYRTAAISAAKYYSLLKDLAAKAQIKWADYPNLDLYAQYMTLYEKTEVERFWGESKKLEREVRARLCKDDRQFTLAEISDGLGLLKDFYEIHLAPEDYKYYLANRDKFKINDWFNFLQFQAKRKGLVVPVVQSASIVGENLPKVEAFYKAAQARDIAFINNTVNAMESTGEQAAILIAGGFHTDQLTALMKERGFSYIVISPKMEEEIDTDFYYSILAKEIPCATTSNKLYRTSRFRAMWAIGSDDNGDGLSTADNVARDLGGSFATNLEVTNPAIIEHLKAGNVLEFVREGDKWVARRVKYIEGWTPDRRDDLDEVVYRLPRDQGKALSDIIRDAIEEKDLQERLRIRVIERQTAVNWDPRGFDYSSLEHTGSSTGIIWFGELALLDLLEHPETEDRRGLRILRWLFGHSHRHLKGEGHALFDFVAQGDARLYHDYLTELDLRLADAEDVGLRPLEGETAGLRPTEGGTVGLKPTEGGNFIPMIQLGRDYYAHAYESVIEAMRLYERGEIGELIELANQLRNAMNVSQESPLTREEKIRSDLMENAAGFLGYLEGVNRQAHQAISLLMSAHRQNVEVTVASYATYLKRAYNSCTRQELELSGKEDMSRLMANLTLITGDGTIPRPVAVAAIRRFGKDCPFLSTEYIYTVINDLSPPHKKLIEDLISEAMSVTVPAKKRKIVIMAGGGGNRYFPLGRDTDPKQFVKMFPKGSTFDKVSTFDKGSTFDYVLDRLPDLNEIDEVIFIILDRDKERVRQVVEKKFPGVFKSGKMRIIGEPARGDTSGAIFYAVTDIARDASDDTVIEVYPSDQIVPEEDYERFHEDCQRAVETAYFGPYIVNIAIDTKGGENRELGHFITDRTAFRPGVLHLRRFEEKPRKPEDPSKPDPLKKIKDEVEQLKAQGMPDAAYWWNAGIFIGTVGSWKKLLHGIAGNDSTRLKAAGLKRTDKNYGELFVPIEKAIKAEDRDAEERAVKAAYQPMAEWRTDSKVPSSIDYQVEPLSKGADPGLGIVSSQGGFDWGDPGQADELDKFWHAWYKKHRDKYSPNVIDDKNENLATPGNEIRAENSRNCSVLAMESGYRVHLYGVNRLIIVPTSDVLCVIAKGRGPDVAKLREKLLKKPETEQVVKRRVDITSMAGTAGKLSPAYATNTAVEDCQNVELYGTAEGGVVGAVGVKNIVVIRDGNDIYVYGKEYRKEGLIKKAEIEDRITLAGRKTHRKPEGAAEAKKPEGAAEAKKPEEGEVGTPPEAKGPQGPAKALGYADGELVNQYLVDKIRHGKVIKYRREGDKWVAYRVKYVPDYEPRKVLGEDDTGERTPEYDLSEAEQARLNEYLASAGTTEVGIELSGDEWQGGAPAGQQIEMDIASLLKEIMVVLDETALMWKGELMHSQLVHAGQRSKRIWQGERLFRQLLNTEVKTEYETGKETYGHELQHLAGNHGVDKLPGYKELVDKVYAMKNRIDKWVVTEEASVRMGILHTELIQNPAQVTTAEQYAKRHGLRIDEAKAELDYLAANERELVGDEHHGWAGVEKIDNPEQPGKGAVYRKFDVVKHGQEVAYRTYDARAATMTNRWPLPGLAEPKLFPAMMSTKLMFYTGLGAGNWARAAYGEEQLDKMWTTVSGGCRLWTKELMDAYSLGLRAAGLKVMMVRHSKVGLEQLDEWLGDDIRGGRRLPEEASELAKEYKRYDEAGVISTPQFYFATRLLRNSYIGTGIGKAARKLAKRLFQWFGHMTGSHNPAEYNGAKQVSVRTVSEGAALPEDKKSSGLSPADEAELGEDVMMHDYLLSINDEQMTQIRNRIINKDFQQVGVGNMQPDSKVESISPAEIAYLHNEYVKARVRLGNDVWGFLLKQAMAEAGGLERLLHKLRRTDWDKDWGKIKDELGVPKVIFSKRPPLCQNKPYENIAVLAKKLGKKHAVAVDFMHGSAGLSARLYRELGLPGELLLTIRQEPDGTFRGEEPYPNLREFTKHSVAEAKAAGVPLFCKDEDADRNIFYWMTRMMQGDMTMAMNILRNVRKMAALPAEQRRKLIFIGEVKYSSVAETMVKRAIALVERETGQKVEAEIILTPVGFGYIKDVMEKINTAILNNEEEVRLFGGRPSPVMKDGKTYPLVVDIKNAEPVILGSELSGHQMDKFWFAEDELAVADSVLGLWQERILQALATHFPGREIKNLNEEEAKFLWGTLEDAVNEVTAVYVSPELRPGSEDEFAREQVAGIAKLAGDAETELVLKKAKRPLEELHKDPPSCKELVVQGARTNFLAWMKDNYVFELVSGAAVRIAGGYCFVYRNLQRKPAIIDLGPGYQPLEIEEIYINMTDGALIYFKCKDGRGSFVLRKSNTQPEIICRFEGANRKQRDAIAALMFGFFEKYPGTHLTRDMYLFYEVLPMLAFNKLSDKAREDIEKFVQGKAARVLGAIATGRIAEGLKVEDLRALGYFARSEKELEEEFWRIQGVADEMVSAGRLPSEEDLRTIIDAYLGNGLSPQILQEVRAEQGRVTNEVKSYGSAELYKNLPQLVARYVNRRLRDHIKDRDVAELRQDDLGVALEGRSDWEDLSGIQEGRELLIGGKYLFKVVKQNKPGIYTAVYKGIEGVEPPAGLTLDDVVTIRRFPTAKGVIHKAGEVLIGTTADGIPSGEEIAVFFDEHAIGNDRHTGFFVTKKIKREQPPTTPQQLQAPEPKPMAERGEGTEGVAEIALSAEAQNIFSMLESERPEVRKGAVERLKVFYPELDREIEAHYASLPVPGHRILARAIELGRPVIAPNLDNGELSILQLHAILKAARDMNAFVYPETGPGALLTYPSDEPQLPEYCARIAAYSNEPVDGGVVVYGVHLDHNQPTKVKAKDYDKDKDGAREKALKELIDRARFAIANGFTSLATDTSTLTLTDKEELSERLVHVIETAAQVLKVVYEEAAKLGVNFGLEGEVGDIDEEGHISTVDEALAYFKGVARRLNEIAKEAGIDFEKQPPLHIIAVNIGSTHGYDFNENDEIIPYQGGEITEEGLLASPERKGLVLSRAREIIDALEKEFGVRFGIALHGFSGTPISVAGKFVNRGIAKVNINTDWQAMTWKVLKAYYPELYRKIYDDAYKLAMEARKKELEKAGKDPKYEPEYGFVTGDIEADFKTAQNRIIFGFARRLFRLKEGRRDEPSHKLMEEIIAALEGRHPRYGPRYMRFAKVSDEQAQKDYLSVMLSVEECSGSEPGALGAIEALHKLTYDRMMELMNDQALGLRNSADGVKVDREAECRLQQWQISELKKRVAELEAERQRRGGPSAEQGGVDFGELLKRENNALILDQFVRAEQRGQAGVKEFATILGWLYNHSLGLERQFNYFLGYAQDESRPIFDRITRGLATVIKDEMVKLGVSEEPIKGRQEAARREAAWMIKVAYDAMMVRLRELGYSIAMGSMPLPEGKKYEGKARQTWLGVDYFLYVPLDKLRSEYTALIDPTKKIDYDDLTNILAIIAGLGDAHSKTYIKENYGAQHINDLLLVAMKVRDWLMEELKAVKTPAAQPKRPRKGRPPVTMGGPDFAGLLANEDYQGILNQVIEARQWDAGQDKRGENFVELVGWLTNAGSSNPQAYRAFQSFVANRDPELSALMATAAERPARDLGGPKADNKNLINPIIGKLIKQNQVVELTKGEDGIWVANRVLYDENWTRNTAPGSDLGDEIWLLNKKQSQTLDRLFEILKTNILEAKQDRVRIRLVEGTTAVHWDRREFDYSSLEHTGAGTGIVWFGEQGLLDLLENPRDEEGDLLLAVFLHAQEHLRGVHHGGESAIEVDEVAIKLAQRLKRRLEEVERKHVAATPDKYFITRVSAGDFKGAWDSLQKPPLVSYENGDVRELARAATELYDLQEKRKMSLHIAPGADRQIYAQRVVDFLEHLKTRNRGAHQAIEGLMRFISRVETETGQVPTPGEIEKRITGYTDGLITAYQKCAKSDKEGPAELLETLKGMTDEVNDGTLPHPLAIAAIRRFHKERPFLSRKYVYNALDVLSLSDAQNRTSNAPTLKKLIAEAIHVNIPREKRWAVVICGSAALGTDIFARALVPGGSDRVVPSILPEQAETLVEHAIKRLIEPGGPGHIALVAPKEFKGVIKRLLETKYQEYSGRITVFEEPILAGTAAAVLYAAAKISHIAGDDAIIETYIANHTILEKDHSRFQRVCRRAGRLAALGPYVNAIAVNLDDKDPKQFGNLLLDDQGALFRNMRMVAELEGRPDEEKLGEWREDESIPKRRGNTGCYFFTVATLRTALGEVAGDTANELYEGGLKKNPYNYARLFNLMDRAIGTKEESETVNKVFQAFARIREEIGYTSLDHILTEPLVGKPQEGLMATDKVGMTASLYKGSFDDLGSPHRLATFDRSARGKGPTENFAVGGELTSEADSEGCSVLGQPERRYHLFDAKDIVVVDSGNVILVVDKDAQDDDVNKRIPRELQNRFDMFEWLHYRSAQRPIKPGSEREHITNCAEGTTLFTDERLLVAAFLKEPYIIVKDGSDVYVYGPEHKEAGERKIADVSRKRFQRETAEYLASRNVPVRFDTRGGQEDPKNGSSFLRCAWEYFFRGANTIAYLFKDPNHTVVNKWLIYAGHQFEIGLKKIGYVMNHIAYPHFTRAILKLEEEGKIVAPLGTTQAEINSNKRVCDTYFTRDTFPGSFQCMTTNSHYQAGKLDVKFLTEGAIVQLSPCYDETGKLIRYKARYIDENMPPQERWFVSLPGEGDIMVCLSDTARFSDISVELGKEVLERYGWVSEMNEKRYNDQPAKGLLFTFFKTEDGRINVCRNPEAEGLDRDVELEWVGAVPLLGIDTQSRDIIEMAESEKGAQQLASMLGDENYLAQLAAAAKVIGTTEAPKNIRDLTGEDIGTRKEMELISRRVVMREARGKGRLIEKPADLERLLSSLRKDGKAELASSIQQRVEELARGNVPIKLWAAQDPEEFVKEGKGKIWGKNGVGELWYGSESVVPIDENGRYLMTFDCLLKYKDAASSILGGRQVKEYGGSPLLLKELRTIPIERVGDLSVQLHENKNEIWIIVGTDPDVSETKILLGISKKYLDSIGELENWENKARAEFRDLIEGYLKAVAALYKAAQSAKFVEDNFGEDLLYTLKQMGKIDDPKVSAQVKEVRDYGEQLKRMFGYLPVKVGDVFRVKNGMLHAFGYGIVAIEPQIPGATSRIIDWNRQGRVDPAKAREAIEHLALEEGERAGSLQGQVSQDGSYAVELLGQFKGVDEVAGLEKRMDVERIRLNKDASYAEKVKGNYLWLAVSKGSVKLEMTNDSGKKFEVTVKVGDAPIFIPAGMKGYTLVAQEEAQVIRVYAPLRESEALEVSPAAGPEETPLPVVPPAGPKEMNFAELLKSGTAESYGKILESFEDAQKSWDEAQGAERKERCGVFMELAAQLSDIASTNPEDYKKFREFADKNNPALSALITMASSSPSADSLIIASNESEENTNAPLKHIWIDTDLITGNEGLGLGFIKRIADALNKDESFRGRCEIHLFSPGDSMLIDSIIDEIQRTSEKRKIGMIVRPNYISQIPEGICVLPVTRGSNLPIKATIAIMRALMEDEEWILGHLDDINDLVRCINPRNAPLDEDMLTQLIKDPGGLDWTIKLPVERIDTRSWTTVTRLAAEIDSGT